MTQKQIAEITRDFEELDRIENDKLNRFKTELDECLNSLEGTGVDSYSNAVISTTIDGIRKYMDFWFRFIKG